MDTDLEVERDSELQPQGRRAPARHPPPEAPVAAGGRGGVRPGVQGVGARCLRAGRAGHLGAPPPAPGPLLQRAGRPAAAARRRAGHPRRRRRRRRSSTSPSACAARAATTGRSPSTSPASSSSAAPRPRCSTRYLAMIQVQRQDFNGRMLTIRRDDLRAIACILDVTVDRCRPRLDEPGSLPGPLSRRRGPAPSADAAVDRSASTSTCRSARARCDYCAFATWTDRAPPASTRYLDGLPARGRAAPSPRAAAGDERVRRRRHAVAGARRPAWSRCSTAVPRAPGRRGHRRVQPRHGHARARSPPTRRRRQPAVASACSRWSPHVLAALGRTHDPANVAPGGRRWPATAGFATFNLDLIYGAAGESLDDWRRTLDERARARAAARQRLRADRRAGHAAGRRPGPPSRRRRPGRQVLAGRRRASRPPGSRGTRSRTGPGPATSAATTSSTGRRATTSAFGCAAHSHRGGRRWWNVRTPERYIDGDRGRASRPRRPARGSTPRSGGSRGCSSRCAPGRRAGGGAAGRRPRRPRGGRRATGPC